MKRVLPTDFYSSSRITLFSYIDIRMLVDLYLPLIGSNALSVFLRLQQDESSKDNEIFHHQRLFDALRLTAGEFEAAIRVLEAVGLVKTYVSPGEGVAYFVYVLYSPFSPKKFFDDPLLYGTFLKYVGKEEANRLKEKYKDKDLTKGMVDVSDSFQAHFDPDLSEGYYGESLNNGGMRDRRYAKANIAFDRPSFESEWKENGKSPTLLSDFEKERIEKIAVLYGITAKTAAQIAIDSLTFLDGRETFDEIVYASKCVEAAPFSYLKQEKGKVSSVSSETHMAKFIKMLDTTSPASYLASLQGGHRPAKNDLDLLWKLAMEVGLPNGVINALVSFVLQRNNNVLSAAYIDKVGAYLMREGCKSARDAMECLKKMDKAMKRTSKTTETPKKEKDITPISPSKAKKEEKKEEKSDEEIDAMLDALFLDLEKKKRKD